MRKVLVHLLALIVLISCFLTIDIHSVYACSGGVAVTIEGLLDASDYVAKVRAIESDDAAQNMVLQVQTYLVGGSGPEFILFFRQDPIITEYILAGRSTGGDCLGLSPRLNSGDTFYVFLNRQNNGSYSSVQGFFNPSRYMFSEEQPTVEVYLEGGYQNGDQVYEQLAERDTGQQVTEEEFLEIIASESGELPTSPNPETLYPLKAPILITTDSGVYLQPVDWQAPILFEDSLLLLEAHPLRTYGFSDALTCAVNEQNITISPDNLNIAIPQDDGTICFTYGYTTLGQSVQFSTTSDTVAIWDLCQLTVATIGYPRLLQDWYDIETINQIELSGTECQAYHEQSAWSPDGRMLAYVDEEGIWLWNAFNLNAEPYLLISNNGNTRLSLNRFSPSGYYLNYSTNEMTFNVDIYTGEILPDGMFSPDERIIINYETNEICTISIFECNSIEPAYLSTKDSETGEVTGVFVPSEILKTQWQDNSTFYQLTCTSDEPILCGVFRFRPYHIGWVNTLVSNNAVDFEYDNSTSSLAIIQGDSTLIIDGYTINLAGQIEDVIQDIQWMPSLFYYD